MQKKTKQGDSGVDKMANDSQLV